MSRFAAVVLLLMALPSTESCARRNLVVEVPEGFVGWVTIQYDAKDCPPERGVWTSVVRVRADGTGCATKWNGTEGLAFVRCFYVDKAGRRIRQLKNTGWGKGGEKWGGRGAPVDKKYYTFIGTEEQYLDPRYRRVSHP